MNLKKCYFKRIVSLSLTFVMIISLFTGMGITVNAATTDDGFEYKISYDEVTITGYIGDETELIIPSEVDGYHVTSIGDWAFSAFDSLPAITSITLHDNINSIGYEAFYNTAFYNDSSNWESGVLYIGNHLIDVDTAKSGEYIVPSGTKCIAGGAFSNCNAITSITLPDSVIGLCERTFSTCTSLTTITIPNLVESIEDSAFYYCSSLKSIVIPDSVTYIGEGAFLGCNSLTDVYFTGMIEQWLDVSICNNNDCLVNAAIHATDGDISGNGSSATPGYLLESLHPYESDCDEIWVITEENAQSLSVLFSDNTYTEYDYDFITLYTADDTEIGKFSGDLLAGFMVVVPGDTLKIRLTSDSSVEDYGFGIVSIESWDFVVDNPIIPGGNTDDDDSGGDTGDDSNTIYGMEYKIKNDEITITDCTGTSTNVGWFFVK